MTRRTRIVATLGPATDADGVLEALVDAGLDVARINFSHGTAESHTREIARVRQAAAARGKHIGVLADLPGPKLRAIIHEALALQPGLEVSFVPVGAAGDIHVTEPEIIRDVRVGHPILLDDGRLQLRAIDASPEKVIARVEVGGTLLPNKGINLPETPLSIPALTERDRKALAVAVAAGADWIGLSFVREPAAASQLRDALRALGADLPILAKIERPEAVAQAEAIIDAFDGIMVARGDLGVEIPLEKVPLVQKRLIALGRAAGKPVVTATDMLDSMRNSPRPTRAEAGDVANAILEGTDAVMLSGETAVGRYPVEAVQCMSRIAVEADAHFAGQYRRDAPVPRGQIDDHISHETCDLAWAIGARAIIAPTHSGRTVRLVARHRPPAAIVATAPDDAILRRLALVWGVQTVPLATVLQPLEDRLEAAVRSAGSQGAVQPGDLVVVVAGHPIEGGGHYPTIRVVRVGEGGRSESAIG